MATLQGNAARRRCRATLQGNAAGRRCEANRQRRTESLEKVSFFRSISPSPYSATVHSPRWSVCFSLLAADPIAALSGPEVRARAARVRVMTERSSSAARAASSLRRRR